MTRVVNKHKEQFDVYIGRGSLFGNPFSHLPSSYPDVIKVDSRWEAIEKYREWFYEQLDNREFAYQVRKLKGKTLGCYCKPLTCHGDVIVEYLEETEVSKVQDINIDIFDAPIDAIIHQANCQCTMNSGIAYALRARWPAVYEADCLTTKGDQSKLGFFSVANISSDGCQVRFVFNMYSQFFYGRDKRYTDYEAVSRGLEKIKEAIPSYGIKTVGIPYKMGCSLGGGNWRIVRTIIEEIFKDAAFKTLICRKDV